jgi:hypothetical protein
LQSEKAHFDQTVRDANNGIVMFKYGGDCLDPVKLMKVRTKVLTLPGTSQEVAVRWCGGEGVEAERLAPVVALAKKAGGVFGKEVGTTHLPFDLFDYFRTTFDGPCPTVEEILPLVLDAEKEIVRIIGDELSCNHLLVHIRSTVVSNRLPGVSTEEVKNMLDQAVEKTERAVITGGEMVGTLAAQSIGEPATQMVSYSFLNVSFSIYLSQRIFLNSTYLSQRIFLNSTYLSEKKTNTRKQNTDFKQRGLQHGPSHSMESTLANASKRMRR